jgi:hypothetical protein
MHVLFAYEAVVLSVTGALGPLPRKSIFLGILVASVAGSFWYYGWVGNGQRVVSTWEKLGEAEKYTQLGRIIWWETLLLPFIFAGVFITTQKLTGWPPHP